MKLFLLFFGLTAIINITELKSAGDDCKIRPTIILDAGHGGLDGGAVAADGTLESELNLSITIKAKELFHLLGIRPILTRDSAELPYPSDLSTIHEKKLWDQTRRIDAINGENPALLISIHQNNYPDSRPSGAQIFYGSNPESIVLAKSLQDRLNDTLCTESRRLAASISPEIYLFKNIHCPAVLMECGFLSNPSENARLKTDSYQKKLALVLVSSCTNYLSA